MGWNSKFQINWNYWKYDIVVQIAKQCYYQVVQLKWFYYQVHVVLIAELDNLFFGQEIDNNISKSYNSKYISFVEHSQNISWVVKVKVF